MTNGPYARTTRRHTVEETDIQEVRVMVQSLLQVLDRLAGIEGTTTPVLSVYLSLAPERKDWKSIKPRINTLLQRVGLEAASSDLDHDSSMALRAAADEVLAMAGDFETTPVPGVAIFICDEIGLHECLRIPGGVWDCAVAGPTPYLRPLQAAIDQFRRIAVAVLDSRRAEISTYYMGELLDSEVFEAEEVRKSNLAGWHGLEEYRHRLHGEEVRNHLFREVAADLERKRRREGAELLLVGGQHDATQAFLPFLEPRTREVTETFVTDIHTLTPELLVRRVEELEQDRERSEEKREVAETYALAADGDLAAIGVDRVCEAASAHAITRLLLHDGATMEGAVCMRCGALTRPVPTCPRCGGDTRRLPDVFEDLSRAVIDAGGSVEHVMSETRLASDLVAARLRFAPWRAPLLQATFSRL